MARASARRLQQGNQPGETMTEHPELTTLIPNDPRMATLPQGECIITRLDSGCLRIEQADQRIVIGVQLLEQIQAAAMPSVTLTLAAWVSRDQGACYEGAVLRIEAVNRTVSYRITEWLPWYCGCIAELTDS